jgi:hypothetical protein
VTKDPTAPPFRPAADSFSFLIELCSLAALGYWGWTVNVVAAVVAPLVAAIVWGVFCSPRAPVALPKEGKTALQLVVLLGGALALGVAGEAWLAIVLAAAVLVDALLRYRSVGGLLGRRVG